MDKRTGLLIQVVMTFLMALTMSGIMSLIAMGPTIAWLTQWPLAFITAWPIAFVLTMLFRPAAMKVAIRLTQSSGS
ncbi:Protein of unknown function [Nocardioides sp. YR527]|uniref:DUF2798 domain-containing protein n=1 Tax=Nocardioides sp. YR527 TaxID=1881028 RepID=UPI00088C1EE6|nr:DUF2798 domain-containing protein [Nocardioides sp. YR527]SDL31706.1 Protein of unknown function [Nocardioides sp. YR527]